MIPSAAIPIEQVRAREVLDSRGRPTVEVDLRAGGAWGRAIVPSGASTGAAEALELRDGDPARYDGRGVLHAVRHVNQVLGPALLHRDAADQPALDEALCQLDGTPHKARLGANALLGVSLAAAHAAASHRHLPLWRWLHQLYRQAAQAAGDDPAALPPPRVPLPMINLISGGLHAGGNLDFQDVLLMPRGAPHYATQLEWTVRVYNRLGELLSAAGFEGRLVGDEGGYGPRLAGTRQAFEFAVRAIAAAGLTPGRDCTLALDVAATHFYRDGAYHLTEQGGRALASAELGDLLAGLVDDFPLASIEDPLAEEDWPGWRDLTARLAPRAWIVGDDLLATNPDRIARAARERAATAALIKVNQIGTLSETLRAVRAARAAGMAVVVSARSGETEDTTIADLAVAVAADSIKIGSVVRGERLAKYNRLLRIVEELE